MRLLLKSKWWIAQELAVWIAAASIGHTQPHAALLKNPTYSNGQFSFLLLGESKASYTLLSANDFTNWTALAINGSNSSARTIAVAASDQAQFFKVETMPLPLFRFALATSGSISFNGIKISIDSFDSSDATQSSYGQYDPVKARNGGDVGSGAAVTNSVSVGNSKIHGSVATDPKGNVAFGPAGSVTGHITHDMNATFPDPVVPFAEGEFTSEDDGPQVVNGTAYNHGFHRRQLQADRLYSYQLDQRSDLQ